MADDRNPSRLSSARNSPATGANSVRIGRMPLGEEHRARSPVELANEIEYGFNAVKMIFAQARNIRQEHIIEGDNLELAKGEVARVRARRGHPQRRALELFQAVRIAQEVLDDIEERATTSTAHHSDNRKKSVLERVIRDLDAGQIRCLAESVEVDLGAIEEAYLANWSGLVPTSG